jgi:hypothetical protein
MSDIISFKADLNRFAESIDKKVEAVIRQIVIELFNAITLHNPVDTGYSRSNWRVSVNEPDETVSVPPSDKARADTKNRTGWIEAPSLDLSILSNLQSTDSVFVTNSVDYVQYLEEGSSKQAPSGFLRISVAQIEAQVDDIAQRSKEAA